MSAIISKIQLSEIEQILSLARKVFDPYFNNSIEADMFEKYIDDNTDWSISVKLTLNGQIIGAYLLNPDNGLKRIEKYKHLKGIQGVALFVDPDFHNNGYGKMLREYPLSLKYDYIWGQQSKKLNNINNWIKYGRKIVPELTTDDCYVTVMEINKTDNIMNNTNEEILQDSPEYLIFKNTKSSILKKIATGEINASDLASKEIAKRNSSYQFSKIKPMHDVLGADFTNPQSIFARIDLSTLGKIANNDIDPKKLAESELESRGENIESAEFAQYTKESHLSVEAIDIPDTILKEWLKYYYLQMKQDKKPIEFKQVRDIRYDLEKIRIVYGKALIYTNQKEISLIGLDFAKLFYTPSI